MEKVMISLLESTQNSKTEMVLKLWQNMNV